MKILAALAVAGSLGAGAWLCRPLPALPEESTGGYRSPTVPEERAGRPAERVWSPEPLSPAAIQWTGIAPSTRAEEYAVRLLALSDDAAGSIARERLFAAWLAADSTAAAAWVRGRIDDPHFNQLQSALIAAWAPHDPAAAAAWYFALPAAARPEAVLGELVRAMAGQEPAVAAEWYATLEDPALRQEALRAILQGWSGRDFASAIPWIEALPAGGRIDQVLLEVATELSPFDSARALALTGAVGEETARREATAAIVREWARHAPREARAWITQGARPEERALLLSAFQAGAAEAAPGAQ